MRIAVTILGLILLIPMGLQAFTLFAISDAVGRQDTAEAGAIGVLVALIWLVGSAIAIPAPRGAFIAFMLAALPAFSVSGTYGDMAIWGAIALVLAVMSYVGHRQKRAADERKAAYDARVLEALEAQRQ